MIRLLSITGNITKQVTIQQRRSLNLLEWQGKELLQKYNVAIQEFKVLDNKSKLDDLTNIEFPEYVVKAQIAAGGRGKGVFNNGFKGGVHITKKKEEALSLCQKMIGNRLITKQTTPAGVEVKNVMVARSINIKHEAYFSILLDQKFNGPVMIISPAGGMDIESVAEKNPEKIKTIPLDIDKPIDQKTLLEAAQFLGFKDAAAHRCAEEIQKIYELFKRVDALQIEINPLVETNEGEVISVDAKINFDDNAKYRQKDIFSIVAADEETDSREKEAAKYNLNYIAMDGNIGCLVNGAGLAMATMDIINLHGGKAANFLDVGGGVKEEYVINAFQILKSDPKVKSILVNVFGGIVNCKTIAKGIVAAFKTLNLDVPLIVRLEGTCVTEAQNILKESGLRILSVSDLDEAAKTAVASISN